MKKRARKKLAKSKTTRRFDVKPMSSKTIARGVINTPLTTANARTIGREIAGRIAKACRDTTSRALHRGKIVKKLPTTRKSPVSKLPRTLRVGSKIPAVLERNKKMQDKRPEGIGLLNKDSAMRHLRKLRILHVLKEILAVKNQNEIDDAVRASTLSIQISAVDIRIDTIIRYLTKWKVPIKEYLDKIELTDEEIASIKL